MFANSNTGLTIVPALVGAVMPGTHPSLAWLTLSPTVPSFAVFVRTMKRDGADRALDEYRKARAADPSFTAITEDTMNSIGYGLLGAKRTKDAVVVFEQIVADHPDSWNAHDSLGEALAADGRREDAIKAYERSVALNPGNTGGVEALARLRAVR
jgi:tetratricopeptide (TPR) repeat protein